MPSDYHRIREDNIREYGEGTRHLSFLGRLYTDRTHFIFELLQNAEDAGASQMLFRLFEDRLEVTHNGRPFDELDVRGVCGVGEGTKAEDLTQIGKFGIGFKSVYAYTSAPEIHSGDESFRIEHYVRPYPAEPREVGDPWTTLFIFAFDAAAIDASTASREIGARLRNLSVRTLLFLRKTKEIGYISPDQTGGAYLRDEVARGAARQVTVVGQNNGEDEDETWLIFERPVPVPTGSYEVPVEVGFRLEATTEEKTEGIVRVKDAPLVVYFPTEKVTRFGFLIQGPYRTTPARDNIPKDDDWNATLVRETAVLIPDVLHGLKDLGLLSVPLLEALPIRMEDFPEDSMFFPIVAAARDALAQGELLPADDGNFVAAENAKLARGADLRRLLHQDQLSALFEPLDQVKWLTGEITQDRTADLRSYLLDVLDIEEVTPEDFARKVTEAFLERQTDDWFVTFYQYLSGQEALWRAPRYRWDTGGVLRTKPMLRLEDGTHRAPFQADGTTPSAFLPPPEGTDFDTVKRTIADDEQARDFLTRLGLSEPDLFDDIVERVLPKYGAPHVSSIPQHEHAMDIQKILRAMGSDSEAGRRRVTQAARQVPFVRSIDASGTTALKKPDQVYVDNPDLRLYFSSSTDAWFLAETPPDLAPDINVWRQLGVAHLPRRLLLSEGLPPEMREYSTRGQTVENRDLHGLATFLDSLQSIPVYEEAMKAALVLWEYLGKHLEADPRFFEGRYSWFYYQEHTKLFDSCMLTRLRNTEWLPSKNQSLERPCDLTADQLLDECAGADGLVRALGIRPSAAQSGMAEEEKRREHASELGVTLEDIEFVKSHPEEIERLKATIAARNEIPVFPTRTVADPERRQERLAKQLTDAPEKRSEERSRSVRVTRDAIDPEVWLRNQYTNDAGQMVCQICKREMPFRKRDGEYYFERREALSSAYFGREHEAQFLALCPLCSAMYEEFVQKSESAMEDLNHALLEASEPEVSVSLGELNTTIRFVESHFSDIKTILGERV